MSMERKQKIISVDAGSCAEKAGILPDDLLLSINGEPVLDLVDYEYLCASEDLTVVTERAGKGTKTFRIRKDSMDPLGLQFETSLMSEIRTCRNNCVFCFVDQMPKGMRPSLSFKDDDWRMSFIMGNYITLTNVSDEELDRIIRRKVSPLYISVHATDPEVRRKLMCNRFAGNIMDRLKKLRDAGIRFHIQVVLCPGLNDGPVLMQTLEDLKSLYPGCGSVAIVPVGLTRFREGLHALRPYTAEEAMDVIMLVSEIRDECLRKMGTRFAFLSDEWYLLAGVPLPEYEEYEAFGQIENGVGLLRLFEDDFNWALSDRTPLQKTRHVSIAGGTSCHLFFKNLYRKLEEYGIRTDLYPVRNDFFGGNVCVAGLVTGSDLLTQLKGKLKTEELLIPANMLREQEDVFLDNITLEELEEKLAVRIRPFGSGDELIDLLFDEEETI